MVSLLLQKNLVPCTPQARRATGGAFRGVRLDLEITARGRTLPTALMRAPKEGYHDVGRQLEIRWGRQGYVQEKKRAGIKK